MKRVCGLWLDCPASAPVCACGLPTTTTMKTRVRSSSTAAISTPKDSRAPPPSADRIMIATFPPTEIRLAISGKAQHHHQWRRVRTEPLPSPEGKSSCCGQRRGSAHAKWDMAAASPSTAERSSPKARLRKWQRIRYPIRENILRNIWKSNKNRSILVIIRKMK